MFLFYLIKFVWRRLGRLLVPLRLRIARILYRNPDFKRSVTKLDPWTVLKGSTVATQEAEAMIFVRKHTSIPIPTLLDVWELKDASYGFIRISMCRGVQLDEAWPNMTDSSRSRTVNELKAYMQELRGLQQPAPHGWVGSTNRRSVYCPRISMMGPRGPWNSGKEFHSYLLECLEQYRKAEELKQKFARVLSYNHDIVYSHADLSFENILVDQNTGKVTAILDWSMAGWWPEYWEYRKAMYGSRPGKKWWVDLVKTIMAPWKDEFSLDSELQVF
ncbi:hypothetical protein JR316_0001471 [Psilocybe cubensis]|uniref:Aminoglycoside phosphotransferase domain-containing protein n=2 Tax=Psilocybe cubensis TaxID=181762 RepID=A0A8H8CQA8_PSICU|nr:hypothetical protein JR316_0001471 [Psilocybe cubensis]KAH9487396.1 hypothetical protein JR316_0001471 [Psilocybe cubensis]